MLFRDLLLTIPGIVGAVASPLRADETKLSQESAPVIDSAALPILVLSKQFQTGTGIWDQESALDAETTPISETERNTDTDWTPLVQPLTIKALTLAESMDTAHSTTDQADISSVQFSSGAPLLLQSVASTSSGLGASLGQALESIDTSPAPKPIAVAESIQLALSTTPNNPGTPVDPTELPLRLEKLTAEAGRVLTVEPTDNGDIASIRILSQGEHGHISVNPDHSLALVLSEEPGNTSSIEFSYEITYANGDTRQVNSAVTVTPGQQAAGWSLGDSYMLETDSNDSLVIEHGDNHRKFYVTASADGLTREDIAKAEGLNANAITVAWLQKNPEYGGSEAMALATELGMELWYASTSGRVGPHSNWLLLERGYQYDDIDRLVHRGATGESALHPVVIGAYGSGADPIITDPIKIYQEMSAHVVVQNIHLKGGFMALTGQNILLDNLTSTGMDLNVQNVERFTLRNSEVMDVFRDAPVGDPAVWHAHLNRMGGAYVNASKGVLIEGNFFDHNGWADGYDYNLSGSKPQPPSYYSHNFYLDFANTDLTFRDNISMRAASFGAQVRSGGYIEDNAFIDNNAAVNFLGGDYLGAGPIGNYTLYMGNLITSAGHKRVSDKEGALSMGIEDHGRQTSLIDNIIAHLADPANAKERAEKGVTHNPYRPGENTYYNDTIIYNWLAANARKQGAQTDVGVNGLPKAVLNETTIQNFTADLLGKSTATIADLANYLRGQAAGRLDAVVDADIINAFFREGFGLATALRVEAATLRFAPDARGDGMRWDNRLNWSTSDLPGTQDGDSVDLGGNRVLLASKTVEIDDFIFGEFGELKVSSGRLNIAGQTSVADTGNLLQIANAGQVWIAGYRDSDVLTVQMEGGRFANTGAFLGKAHLTVGNDAQALLATSGASFDLKPGSRLIVNGSDALAGFDGSDGKAAVLRMHDGSTTRFVADADGFGQIDEFRSGAFGASPNVTSGVMLNGTLRIDLGAWSSNTKATNVTLIDADQILGDFDAIRINGLGDKRDALVRIDYVRDEVILVLGEAGKGTGQIRTSTTGESKFIDYSKDAALADLWQILHEDASPGVNDPF